MLDLCLIVILLFLSLQNKNKTAAVNTDDLLMFYLLTVPSYERFHADLFRPDCNTLNLTRLVSLEAESLEVDFLPAVELQNDYIRFLWNPVWWISYPTDFKRR